MTIKLKIGFYFASFLLFLSSFFSHALAENADKSGDLDEKVNMFLAGQRGKWVDWNVPEVDGKVLYDLIVKNNYRRAVEIGTSTGHSAIWMAWALSKTGGKLVTIEIDEGRYKQALANFKKAGLSDYIDARLANAHQLVKELKGPFDFVFSDADKDWYKNYFVALAPKLEVGGCFTAHNVASHWGGIREFLDYVESLPNFETTIDRSSSAGISISYKIAEQ
ncbi:MAG: class I SAM-dependent methyltransferase [Desulfobacterales bacterium]|nr:MAG: class I SAM-dependent methyltransferase [Desulfobacterales bacterium]